MSVREKPNQHLLSLFHEQSCWMIEPLAAEMKYSIPSVRRFLAEVGYFSSFTHNGGWYTLRSIPRFGQDGLWFHADIGFSRAGSFVFWKAHALPAADGSHSLYCAVIVKQVDEQTRARTSVNEILRHAE